MTRNSGEGTWASAVFGKAVSHAALAQSEIEMDILVPIEIFGLKETRGRTGFEHGPGIVQEEEEMSGRVASRDVLLLGTPRTVVVELLFHVCCLRSKTNSCCLPNMFFVGKYIVGGASSLFFTQVVELKGHGAPCLRSAH